MPWRSDSSASGGASAPDPRCPRTCRSRSSWPSGSPRASCAAGERLPPERELAKGLGVSRMTVRQALGSLAARGPRGARRRARHVRLAAQARPRPGARGRPHRAPGAPGPGAGRKGARGRRSGRRAGRSPPAWRSSPAAPWCESSACAWAAACRSCSRTPGCPASCSPASPTRDLVGLALRADARGVRARAGARGRAPGARGGPRARGQGAGDRAGGAIDARRADGVRRRRDAGRVRPGPPSGRQGALDRQGDLRRARRCPPATDVRVQDLVERAAPGARRESRARPSRWTAGSPTATSALRAGGGEYVLRLPGKDTGLLEIDREAERAANAMAASAGVGAGGGGVPGRRGDASSPASYRRAGRVRGTARARAAGRGRGPAARRPLRPAPALDLRLLPRSSRPTAIPPRPTEPGSPPPTTTRSALAAPPGAAR